MCPITKAARDALPASEPGGTRTTCFNCTRVNGTTFLVVEDDKWNETPFIYVKVYDNVLVLVDTGCGGAAKNEAATLTNLREFLETYPVEDNEGRPLNLGAQRDYIVLCSHCHFDHIGV
ncbi:hypothetical protein F5B20DRAFT_103853 [Whalleya microplaca]|nr:hypothetical protein F5B20DRAFT_103853 [Whalleya microplaca]